MALSITELKKGTLVQLNGQPYKVIDYAQKVMGRGGSIVTTRLKNLIDGSVTTQTFKGSEKLQPAEVTNGAAQYLYSDAAGAHFMDEKTFDQFSIDSDILGNNQLYLKEGQKVTAQSFQGRVINVELPLKLELTVQSVAPGVKGDTVSAATKPATLETGATVQVPLFIKAGDRVIIDTRDGSYVERAK